MMQLKRWNLLLACLCLSLIVGVSLATATQEAPMAETTAAETTDTETTNTATTGPACGAAASQTLAADIIQIEELEPKGYCNCNVSSDCDKICGEGGGGCLITIPCEEPTRYSGWCHCNGGIEPIEAATAE